MSVSKICAVCSKSFTVPEARALTAKTCSQKCRGVLIAAAYDAQRIECQCKQCGKVYKQPKSHAGRRVYCSRKCAAESYRGVPIGPFSPDGITTMHSDGYVLVRVTSHPFNVSGYVMQHRLIVEDWLREACPTHAFLVDVDGVKYLRRDIDVHHGNEEKADNRRENLTACTHAAHRDIHDGRAVMRGTVWPERGDEIEPISRMVKRQCLQCGTAIESKLSAVKRGGGKFCSLSCKATWHGARSKKAVKRNCVQCGTEFEAWPSNINQGGGKFCSNECRFKSRIGRNPKESIPYP